MLPSQVESSETDMSFSLLAIGVVGLLVVLIAVIVVVAAAAGSGRSRDDR